MDAVLARPTPERRPLDSLSIVIPHYGDPAHALALVRALQQQGPAGLEIVVSDDHSPRPFPPETPGTTVVRRERNGGFGAAVNTGVRAAAGELVLVMNSDLTVPETFLADLLSAAAPWMPAVVSPQVHGHDGAPGWVGRRFPTTGHQVVEWLTPLARLRGLRALHAMVGHDTRCVDGAEVPVDWVVGACMLLPREAFLAVGGLDEGFFMNCEEIDLQRRLREQGVGSVFLGTVCVEHEGGGSSDAARRRGWLVASRLRYARKWNGAAGERRLRRALVAASWVNFAANRLRQAAGRPVRAREVLEQELALARSAGTGQNAD